MKLLKYLGIDPIAIEPAVQSFTKSMLFTGAAVASSFALAAASQSSSPGGAVHWMQENWWPFAVAQIIAPTLRGVVALNHFTPSPLAPSVSPSAQNDAGLTPSAPKAN